MSRDTGIDDLWSVLKLAAALGPARCCNMGGIYAVRLHR
jgi:hypothetical protein